MKEIMKIILIIFVAITLLFYCIEALTGKSYTKIKSIVTMIAIYCLIALVFFREKEGDKYSGIASIGLKALLLLIVLQIIELLPALSSIVILATFTICLEVIVIATAVILDIISFDTSDYMYNIAKMVSVVCVIAYALLYMIMVINPTMMVEMYFSSKTPFIVKLFSIVKVLTEGALLATYALMIDVSRGKTNIERKNNAFVQTGNNIGFGYQSMGANVSNETSQNLINNNISNLQNNNMANNVQEQSANEPSVPDIDLSSYGSVSQTNNTQEQNTNVTPQEPATPDIDLSSYGNDKKESTQTDDNNDGKVNLDDLL